MPPRTSPGAVDILLEQLDQAFDHKAWHGTNLLGSVRRVTSEEAVWRPAEGRHNIWELVIHAAYWKYTVRRRLSGERRGSFAKKGSNWFQAGNASDGLAWKRDVALLRQEHRLLREAVAAIDPRRLAEVPSMSRFRTDALIVGAASHDLYHAGQIQLIKRLQKSEG